MTDPVSAGAVATAPLRVAAGQAEAVAGDLAANVDAAVRLVVEAAEQEARLLVLPEAFLTGYDLDVFARSAVPADDLDRAAWLDPLREAAEEAGLVVVVSTPLRRAGGATLTMLVVGDDGSVVAPYDKQHLDADERPFFRPGDAGASIVVDDLELGLSICYDSSFPEHARAAADAGAVGYLCSAAFFPGSAHRRDVALAARALDNGLYAVLAAATGRCGRQRFIGGSGVWDPEGRVVAQLGDEPGVAVADLDPVTVDETRAVRRMHADRCDSLGGRRRVVVG